MASQKTEYDLYLPLTFEDGRPVGDAAVKRIRKTLVDMFGGVTDFRHRNEGLWKVGGVTYRDDIVILRVLADESPDVERCFVELKKKLEVELSQASILIVRRRVDVL